MVQMSAQDRRILLASLIEVKELHSELFARQQINSVNKITYLVYDRAERLSTGKYFDADNPTTPGHSN